MTTLGSQIKSIAIGILRAVNLFMGTKNPVKNKGLEAHGLAYNRQRFYGPRKYFCYAPFRSIFVSYDGRVSPCYACKTNASLKRQSLEEIWNGEDFRALRTQMSEGIIPDECSFCRGHLKNQNFGSILAAKYDHHAAENGGFPAIAELELGNECALECVMCCGELSSSIRANREHKTKVESIVDANFVKQFDFCLLHLRAAEFTGGDPFLIPIYKELWSKIEKVNPSLDLLITTNANTMNSTVQALLQGKLKLSFNVSIDSLRKDIYEQIRRNATFENAIKNIQIFFEYTQKHNTSLGFLVCPLQINRYELPDFIEFANRYKATLSYHVVFKPASLALWTMKSDELRLLHSHLVPYQFKGSDFRTRINSRNYDAVTDLINAWAVKAALRESAIKEKAGSLETLINRAKERFWAELSSVIEDDETLKHHQRRIETIIAQLQVEAYNELVFLKLSTITPQEIVQGLNSMNDKELSEKLAGYHNAMYYEFFAGEGLSDNDKYELSMKGQLW